MCYNYTLKQASPLANYICNKISSPSLKRFPEEFFFSTIVEEDMRAEERHAG
jgi:hypothetical protein